MSETEIGMRERQKLLADAIILERAARVLVRHMPLDGYAFAGAVVTFVRHTGSRLRKEAEGG